MPLFKRKPYGLIKPPDDLKSQELVFQVRFTKEIFRDYQEYLKRINLYRQRVWTCKVTFKSNLTYEEALVSERRATEKVQQFPKEFMGPVLNLVQFSLLRLDELVNTILKVFREHFMVGEEIVCVQGNFTLPCKILKEVALEEQGQDGILKYEVGLLDSEKNITRTSVESVETLVRKKFPFSRALLKSFIRESVSNNTSRNAPWVVHEKLCRKYKITTEPPEELKKFFVKEESVDQEPNGAGKRSPTDDMVLEAHVYKKRRRKEADGSREGGNKSEDEKVKQEDVTAAPVVKEKPIKYPIEDSLVQPCPDDPPFSQRPVPSSDFPISMDCVGPLLMVWNFCTLFGKAIHLSPFSLEEFEKALECSDGDPLVLREANHALLKVVISDPAVHQSFVQKRRRKTKVSIQTWKDDLCDFLEVEGLEKLVPHLSSIRKGNYRQLEPSIKLDILCELVNRSLDSPAVRDQLDVYIEEKQAIAAQKRREEVEEIKKSKEVKEQLRLIQSSDTAHDSTAHDSTEPNTRVHPEDSDSDGEADEEELSTEKNFDSNGVPNGACENGVVEDDNVSSLRQSRQSKLKLKAALKEAEEKEKEKKKIEEQKKIQEKRRVHYEVTRERKVQEKKMIELQRRQQHLEREIEKRVIRMNPLGRDRDYNRYWFFHREGRVFVENQDSTRWGYYSAKEELDALFGSLNLKGVRERALQRQLEKQLNKISDALQKRSKDIAQRIALEDASTRRSSRVNKCVPRESGIVAYKNKYRNS